MLQYEEYTKVHWCVGVQSVSNHLQSEQLLRVYSRLMVKRGYKERGELAARMQTSHSVSVEAPFGPGHQHRGEGDGKTARRRKTLPCLLFFTLIDSTANTIIQCVSLKKKTKSVSLKCHVIFNLHYPS